MERRKPRYKIYDGYEGYLIGIGYADSWEQIIKICRDYEEATDGECYLWIAPLNVDTGKYMWTKCGEPIDYHNKPYFVT